MNVLFQQILDPDLRQLLVLLTSEIAYKFNCHQLATVQSFNASQQTATVTLNILRVIPDQLPQGGDPTQPVVPTNKLVNYPLLVDVPVFIASGGGATLTFPVAAGDTCLVLFNDRDIDGWFSTGQVGAPNTSRSHDLADGLALIGFRCLNNPVPSYPTADLALRYSGGQILVNQKINISNATQSLLTSLDALMTAQAALMMALAGWVDTHGDTPNSATLTALAAVNTEFTAVKAQFDALFK